MFEECSLSWRSTATSLLRSTEREEQLELEYGNSRGTVGQPCAPAMTKTNGDRLYLREEAQAALWEFEAGCQGAIQWPAPVHRALLGSEGKQDNRRAWAQAMTPSSRTAAASGAVLFQTFPQ